MHSFLSYRSLAVNIDSLKTTANQSIASAQNNLGYCYEKGNGVLKDYKEAVKWYRKAANQGSSEAQTNLGFCYFYGYGVLADKSMAATYIEKAYNGGIAQAKEFWVENEFWKYKM